MIVRMRGADDAGAKLLDAVKKYPTGRRGVDSDAALHRLDGRLGPGAHCDTGTRMNATRTEIAMTAIYSEMSRAYFQSPMVAPPRSTRQSRWVGQRRQRPRARSTSSDPIRDQASSFAFCAVYSSLEIAPLSRRSLSFDSSSATEFVPAV